MPTPAPAPTPANAVGTTSLGTVSAVTPDDVRSGPDRYVSRIGAARELGRFIAEYGRPVIVTGVRSAQAFTAYTGIDLTGSIANLTDGEGPADAIADASADASADAIAATPILRYDGSATIRNARELAAKSRVLRADVVVAIGGGKLADTAKNVAEILGAHLVIVPTLAATCASYSALSVNYDDHHRFVSAPFHPHNSDLVLVVAGLIATGPREYLIGGIGDTLAKWYESVPVFARATSLSAFGLLSQRSAALIRDVLFGHALAALEALDRGEIDEHLRQVVDAIVGLGGTVGGFGGANARSSGAHAIHDALTFLPESGAVVHGAKVAYGIVVQLVAEGKEDEARELLPFYRQVGLPWSFATMGLTPSGEAFATVAEAAARPGFGFDQAVPGVSAARIADAMRAAEALS